MKSYGTDLFDARKARDTATGNKLPETVLENLIKTDKKRRQDKLSKLKKTYKKWYKIIIKFTLPSSSIKPWSIECVNDLYRDVSAKNYSREERGQSETWVRLESLEHKLLPNKEWLAFFHNIKNKQHLFSLFVTFLCGNDFVPSSTLPILVNNKNETFKIASSVTKVFDCNR